MPSNIQQQVRESHAKTVLKPAALQQHEDEYEEYYHEEEEEDEGQGDEVEIEQDDEVAYSEEISKRKGVSGQALGIKPKLMEDDNGYQDENYMNQEEKSSKKQQRVPPGTVKAQQQAPLHHKILQN